jgi:hypothetical protein
MYKKYIVNILTKNGTNKNYNVVISNNDTKEIEEDFNKTCIFDYLEIMKMEYQFEINKKHTLENRVNFVLTFFAAFGVTIFDRIDFTFFRNLSYLKFDNIVSCIILLFFFWILNKLFFILKGRKLPNFGVIENFDLNILENRRVDEVKLIINDYQYIILERRKSNEENTQLFNKTLKKIFITIVLIFIYKILSN